MRSFASFTGGYIEKLSMFGSLGLCDSFFVSLEGFRYIMLNSNQGLSCRMVNMDIMQNACPFQPQSFHTGTFHETQYNASLASAEQLG